MIIDFEKLEVLKYKMYEAKDLSEPMIYFFDHFADHEEFLKQGFLVEGKFLTQMIGVVGKLLFKKKKIKIKEKRLTKLPEYNFIHGSCFVNKCLMTVAFFTDVKKGIFAIVVGEKTYFGRLTTEVSRGKASPFSLN